MSSHPAESKRLLSHTIAEWTCALKYEHLSPEAIQAAKLFWFDSIGCAPMRAQAPRATGGLRRSLFTTGHGDVLVRPAAPESNVLNIPVR